MFLHKLGDSKPRNQTAKRPANFRPVVETLEERKLLSAVSWTVTQALSSLTIAIPDQSVTVNGITTTAELRNQNQSTSNDGGTWTTNHFNISGTLATDYTDLSSIQFLTGQSNLSAVQSGSYRPNPSSFDPNASPNPAYTDTSTAPADIGARLQVPRGFSFVPPIILAYLGVDALTYDVASGALPISGTTYPVNTSVLSPLTGTAGLDLQQDPLLNPTPTDYLEPLQGSGLNVGGTDTSPTGTVANLGGLQRQLTLPVNIPINFTFTLNGSTGSVVGTISGQIVATATLPAPDQPPVVDPNGTDPGIYTNNWSGAGPVSVVDPTNTSHGATVTDADDTNLASMTIAIASPTAHDVLNAMGQGNVTVSGGGTATLTLTPTTGGLATLADFQATLRTATYDNTVGPGDAGPGPKTIIFTAVDPSGGTGTASSQVILEPKSVLVTGRFVFYSGSAWDKTGTSPKPYTPLPFSDDNAIATDKSAYIAGTGQATFGNVISYDKGINGIMVDLSPGGNHTAITQAAITSDFTFKVGNNNAPNTWPVNTVLPTTVTVRAGAGVSGSDRVELIWPSGSIKEKWLEVDVMATANTGFILNDVFFYGDAVANSGGGDTVNLSETTSVDELGARNNSASLFNNIPISNVFDYNRDGVVSSVDSLLARNNAQTGLATRYLNIPGGVFSPPPSGDASSGAAPVGDGAMASALTSTSSSPSLLLPPVPAWMINRLADLDLNHGPVANYFQYLAHEDTPKSKAILVKADQAAGALNLDDELLDSLVVGLGLE